MIKQPGKISFWYAFGSSLLALSPVVEATPEDLRNEFNRTLESSDLVNMGTPVFALLGDGKSSFGTATSRPVANPFDIDADAPGFATSLDYSQAFDGAVFHFNGDTAPLQNRLGLGFSGSNTQLTYATGNGEDFAWTSALPGFSESTYRNFSATGFNWQSYGLSHQLGNLQLRGGIVDVNLQDRVDPDVWHSGLSWRGFSGDYFAARRNGVTIGQGLSLGLQVRDVGVKYQEFRDINEHAVRAIQSSLYRGKLGTFGLNLQSGISPFTGADENRFMLTYANTIGHKRGQVASLDGDAEQPAKTGEEEAVVSENRRYKKALIIGGSIVGGAVALSTVSGNADGAEGGFEAQHAAAREILNEVNPKSVRENLEYGGWIYRVADDTYAYTPPNKGELDRVYLGEMPGSATATYHTHAAYDPRYDNEHFSSQDIRVNEYYNVDGYLATPAGRFLFYNHRNGRTDQLGTVAN